MHPIQWQKPLVEFNLPYKTGRTFDSEPGRECFTKVNLLEQ